MNNKQIKMILFSQDVFATYNLWCISPILREKMTSYKQKDIDSPVLKV